ncbi:hypothetical protein [Taibaiella koreensis]|uniref:hypothetical protein n=1 Tax=Taibaiella koreensis TaxID=1268548 RepID=UPI000E59A194|nr:hypothetical protein [Taibaiella koreensis]
MKKRKDARDIITISRLLEESAHTIIENIQEESLAVYCFLRNQFEATDVVSNYLFQFLYRSFFRLDNAGLTREMKAEYFRILADFKTNQNFDLVKAVKHLWSFPALSGKNTLQFSFCTKMANMLDEQHPIYDDKVVSVFGLKQPYATLDFNEKLQTYLAQLSIIRDGYKSIVDKELLPKLLESFDNRFDSYPVTTFKKLDFIFWSAGKTGKFGH